MSLVVQASGLTQRYGEQCVVDGNVMRVGSRVRALETDPRSAKGRHRLAGWIRSLMDGEPPGQINEALDELRADGTLGAIQETWLASEAGAPTLQ